MLISAVITTYKREFCIIERALKSVLTQTYKEIEIVLVDDNVGVNRYSAAIQEGIKQYPDVHYLQMMDEHGAQYARNKGILESHGDYIAFLDDDDEWLPQKIEKQMRVLMEDVTIGMCYCKGFSVNSENPNKILGIYGNEFFDPEATFEKMVIYDRIGTTSQAVIKREVFENCGYFDVRMKARQDYEMWLRISQKYKMVGIDESLFNHYSHNGQRVSKNWNNCIEAHTRIYEMYRDVIDKNDEAKTALCFCFAKYYRGAHMWRKAFMCYVEIFTISPYHFIQMSIGKIRELCDRSHDA